jgi:hypothetical protein
VVRHSPDQLIDHGDGQPHQGYRRIHCELTGLCHHTGASTVWRILKSHGIDPAQKRTNVTWTRFLWSQAAVAFDFATIDTVLLRRLGSACCSSWTSQPVVSTSTSLPWQRLLSNARPAGMLSEDR